MRILQAIRAIVWFPVMVVCLLGSLSLVAMNYFFVYYFGSPLVRFLQHVFNLGLPRDSIYRMGDGNPTNYKKGDQDERC